MSCWLSKRIRDFLNTIGEPLPIGGESGDGVTWPYAGKDLPPFVSFSRLSNAGLGMDMAVSGRGVNGAAVVVSRSVAGGTGAGSPAVCDRFVLKLSLNKNAAPGDLLQEYRMAQWLSSAARKVCRGDNLFAPLAAVPMSTLLFSNAAVEVVPNPKDPREKISVVVAGEKTQLAMAMPFYPKLRNVAGCRKEVLTYSDLALGLASQENVTPHEVQEANLHFPRLIWQVLNSIRLWDHFFGGRLKHNDIHGDNVFLCHARDALLEIRDNQCVAVDVVPVIADPGMMTFIGTDGAGKPVDPVADSRFYNGSKRHAHCSNNGINNTVPSSKDYDTALFLHSLMLKLLASKRRADASPGSSPKTRLFTLPVLEEFVNKMGAWYGDLLSEMSSAAGDNPGRMADYVQEELLRPEAGRKVRYFSSLRETVTKENVAELQTAVNRGPAVRGGAIEVLRPQKKRTSEGELKHSVDGQPVFTKLTVAPGGAPDVKLQVGDKVVRRVRSDEASALFASNRALFTTERIVPTLETIMQDEFFTSRWPGEDDPEIMPAARRRVPAPACLPVRHPEWLVPRPDNGAGSMSPRVLRECAAPLRKVATAVRFVALVVGPESDPFVRKSVIALSVVMKGRPRWAVLGLQWQEGSDGGRALALNVLASAAMHYYYHCSHLVLLHSGLVPNAEALASIEAGAAEFPGLPTTIRCDADVEYEPEEGALRLRERGVLTVPVGAFSRVNGMVNALPGACVHATTLLAKSLPTVYHVTRLPGCQVQFLEGSVGELGDDDVYGEANDVAMQYRAPDGSILANDNGLAQVAFQLEFMASDLDGNALLLAGKTLCRLPANVTFLWDSNGDALFQLAQEGGAGPLFSRTATFPLVSGTADLDTHSAHPA